VCQFPIIGVNLEQCFFAGYSLRVENLSVTNNFLGIGKTNASGNASRVFWGDLDVPAHTFHFCLTNTKFQAECLAQYSLQETINERRFTNDEYDNSLRRQRNVGKFIEASLNSIWSVRLEIEKESLQWLDPKNGNIGTRLTCMGELFQPQRAEESDHFPNLLARVTVSESQEILRNLCQLLSYANGGFTAPIFIEAERYNPEGQDIPRIQTVSAALTTNYQVTSLEQLGRSWLTMGSNLKSFVSCFSSFEKMIAQPFWRDTFYFVLVQYFQAIRSGNWELVASATGAALERLSHAILVEDETDPVKKSKCEFLYDINQSNQAKTTWNLGKRTGQENISITGKRLRLLLDRIGLTSSRGYNDMQYVQTFLDVRNDAVHPRVSSMTLNQRWRSILQGIQWIDEVLLWRLGYDGKYFDRIAYAAMRFDSTPSPTLEITPRYDLFSRDPNW
jgi:hypothetical protein